MSDILFELFFKFQLSKDSIPNLLPSALRYKRHHTNPFADCYYTHLTEMEEKTEAQKIGVFPRVMERQKVPSSVQLPAP